MENEAFAALLVEHWEYTMEHAPTWATQLGDHRYDDRLEDPSWATVLEGRRRTRDFLERARAIEGLTPRDASSRDLFVAQLESAVASEVCETAQWNLSSMHNPLTEYNRLPQLAPIVTREDAQHLIARYRAIPAAIDAHLANLQMGVEAGRFTNRTTAQRIVEAFDAQLAQPIDSWALVTIGDEAHPDWREEDRSDFRARLREVVESEVAPAYRRFKDFVETAILPSARADDVVGVSALPNGAACYTAQIRAHTTREMTPEELHALGLAEVERINAQMQTLGEALFSTRELREILARLRGDPALFFTTEEEVEAAARTALGRAHDAMGAYFGTLPQAPCEVVRVPDYEAPFTTIAYYRAPNPDGSKPGEYFINTSEPTTRPRFEMQVLAYHEAIPGHHLQIAIAQELGDMPMFRRHTHVTAFIEGWALYTERLADEMGLYSSDLDRMGMLSYDAWRASRLVVDTGMHALGWSRQQAEAFMTEHTALSANNIHNEVDRYISWPGQALAYKVGQLEILRLREEARAALGARFTLPAFHDAVLERGAVTMPMLEAQLHHWMQPQVVLHEDRRVPPAGARPGGDGR